MKSIYCRINGHNKRLQVSRADLPKERGVRPSNHDEKKSTMPGNIWPWRHMREGECVSISYKLANYYQIENSIKGYRRHSKGSLFHYRSDLKKLTVWCVAKEGAEK